MTEEIVCEKNKYGYCKFQDTCHLKHINLLCEDPKCSQDKYQKGHPMLCFYNMRNGYCKFGVYCKYSHGNTNYSNYSEEWKERVSFRVEKVENNHENLLKEIEDLKNDVSNLKKESYFLKSKVEMFNTKVEDSHESIENLLDEESVEPRSKLSNICSECGYKAASKRGLNTHAKNKHIIPQVDGNQSELASDLESSII